jgi:hypothetical protein
LTSQANVTDPKARDCDICFPPQTVSWLAMCYSHTRQPVLPGRGNGANETNAWRTSLPGCVIARQPCNAKLTA